MLLLASVAADFAVAQSKKVAELIKGLSDKNAKVRLLAAEDIGDLATLRLADARAALPALRTALQKDTDPTVRKAVIETLGKIEPDKYASLLADTFKKDKDQTVRLAIVAEIGRLRGSARETLPVLYDAIKTPPEPAKTPPVPVNPKAPPSPAPDPHAVRKAILPVLRQVEPDPKNYLPVLTETLKKDKDAGMRVAIVTILGQLGPRAQDAVPALHDVMKTALAEGQKLAVANPKESSDPGGLRAAILQALGQIAPKAEEYLPVLIDTMKKDREPAVRQTAAVALGRIGSPAKSAVPALLEAYRSSVALSPASDPQGARRAIVEALGKIDPEPKAHLALLLEVLKKDRDGAVLALAAAGTGEMGAPAKSAIPLLKEVLRLSLAAQPATDPQGVRKITLDALSKIEQDTKAYVAVLIDVLQRDRDADVRLAALGSLKKLGAPAKAALPVLLEIQRTGSTAKDDKEKAVAQEAEAVAKALRGN
jgi:HEAT repeat protein